MTKFSKLFLAPLCLLAVLAEIVADEPPCPLIVAHRGLLQHAPENTLANFRACLELRLGFEFDVERTKDGHLVCIHDGTVDRTTNGTGSGNLPKNWQHAARVGIDAILTDYPLSLRTTLRQLKSDSDQAGVPAPVEARLVAKRSKYVLPNDQHGEAFRKRIVEETDVDNLPPSQIIDLVLELKNVSKEDVMIWPGGFITTPELEVDGPGVISPESLTTGSGGGSGGNVQPTIAPGMTHRIPIKSLNPGYDTPSTYWCEAGEYTLKAIYEVYTGLPPLGSPDDEKAGEKSQRYEVTTPPVTVQVVLEGDGQD